MIHCTYDIIPSNDHHMSIFFFVKEKKKNKKMAWPCDAFLIFCSEISFFTGTMQKKMEEKQDSKYFVLVNKQQVLNDYHKWLHATAVYARQPPLHNTPTTNNNSIARHHGPQDLKRKPDHQWDGCKEKINLSKMVGNVYRRQL